MPKALSSKSIVYQCWVLDSIGSKGCIGDIESFKLHLRSTNISYLRFHIVCQCWVDSIGSEGCIGRYWELFKLYPRSRKENIQLYLRSRKTFIVYQCWVLTVEWTPLDLRDASGDIESYSNFISGQEKEHFHFILNKKKHSKVSIEITTF